MGVIMSSGSTTQQQYETRQNSLYIIRQGVAHHNIPIKVKSKAKDGGTETFTYTYHNPDKSDPKYTDSKLVLPKALINKLGRLGFG